MLRLVASQARRYRAGGLGFGGAILKHSLVPLGLLRGALPARGVLLDIGCGEGMLANLVALCCPGLRVRGIDRDAAKIALAQACAAPNALFVCGDFLEATETGAAAAVINDVLHHHPDGLQRALLERAAASLENGGVLALKEVDSRDRADRAWTSFWDSRLYPQDRLNFHSAAEWRDLLSAASFEVLRVERVRHPWPASRTLLLCRRRRRIARRARAPSQAEVLITGGTGFLAGHLARCLLEEGLGGRTVGVSLLARDPSRVPEDLAAACRVIEGDLESLPQRGVLPRGLEAVFHLAAEKDFFAGEGIYGRNVAGTRALLAALRAAPPRRLLYASSIGAVDRLPGDDCAAPLNEDAPCHSSTPYGRSKWEGEVLVRASGLPAVILRLPWCYGPGMTPSTHVRKLAEMVLDGSPAVLVDWPGRVSLLAAREGARAFAFAGACEAALGGTYFVTDGEPLRLGTLLRQIGDLTGRPAALLRVPAQVLALARAARRLLPLAARALFLDVLTADDSRIRRLGFSAAPRGADFLIPLVRDVLGDRHPGRRHSVALVTGAATGIGRRLAARLAARGMEVVLVDKDPAVREVSAALPGSSALVADLAKAEGRARALAAAARGDVSWVVNCAGLGLLDDVGQADAARTRELLRVNIEALTELSAAALANFRAAGEGTLVNMASSAGLQPLPGMAAYAASKAYVLSFTEAAGGERPGEGVCVLAACPGGTDTAFQERAGVARVAGERLLAPDDVAAAVVSAVERGLSGTVFIGGRARLMALAARLLPRASAVLLWKRLMDSARRPREPGPACSSGGSATGPARP